MFNWNKKEKPFASFGGFGGGGLGLLGGAAAAPQVDATGGTTSLHGGYKIHVFKSPGTFEVVDAGPGSLDLTYVVIAGGGGGSDDITGGGGAGAWREGTITMSSTATAPVTIGTGGAGKRSPSSAPFPANSGPNSIAGGDTTFAYPGTPIAAAGGARVNNAAATNGGSGSGAKNPATGGTGTGDPFPGTPGPSPSNGYGNDGGSGSCGGGGGAGGVGGAGQSYPHNPTLSGPGGAGIQVPSAFQHPGHPVPYGYPGPNGGQFWFAGGGSGGVHQDPAGPADSGGGGGAPGNNTYAGGGIGGLNDEHAFDALVNSGGGGALGLLYTSLGISIGPVTGAPYISL